ncbi:MAG: extracellular solute-binding protein [Butyrivibrio sp.]|nr:extracellular solute-binding protein [Butyrivibrio sp.]
MQKRKSLIISFIIITCIVVTSGCGQIQTDAKKSANTITIAARDGSHTDVINAVKTQFETENNCEIKVVSMSADDIHTKVLQDTSNDVATYDIIMIDDPLMPEYIEKNILCNLTQLGYIDDEDFVEKSRLLGKDPYPLGATYALPFSGNVQLIFYNKDNTGDSPDFSNWYSVLDICEKAKENGKNGYAIRGQSGNPIVSDFLPILWSFGGDLFDENNHVILDSKESRDALQFYCELYATGANYDKDGLTEAIKSGDATVALGWPSWFINKTGQTAEIEQIPGKKFHSSTPLSTGEIGNWLLGITTNSNKKDLSLALIQYLTSADVQREALEYGGVPTRISIFRDSSVVQKYPYFEAIYSGTNNSRVRPRTTKWAQIEDVFGAELVKCINNEQSIDDTISNSQKLIESLSVK